MAGAAVAMVLRGAAAAIVPPCLFPPPAKFSSSQPSTPSDHFFSWRNETRSALILSCLSVAVPSFPYTTSTHHVHQAALLPSSLYSLSLSISRTSCVVSRDLKNLGLDVGLNGKFIQDLKRAAVRKRSSRLAGIKVESMSGQPEGILEDKIRSKNSNNAVVVYSKSWCPYCGMVKSLFTKLGVSFEVVELDQLVDEEDVQDALSRLTGQSTVPSVFIGGKHIGGCDDTMALHDRGELIPALEAAGVVHLRVHHHGHLVGRLLRPGSATTAWHHYSVSP